MFSFSQSFPLLIFRCGCVIALFIINHFGILKGSINESLPRCVTLVKDDITIEFVIRKKNEGNYFVDFVYKIVFFLQH